MSREKVAVITAAGKGIGAGIARNLAEAGYKVALMSPSGGAATLAKELGGFGMSGSVMVEADVDALVQGALERFGSIDAVVNNVGHIPSGDLLELDDASWRTGFEMIIMSTLWLSRRVTPILLQNGGGAIVNISAYGAVAPDQAFPISSALRAALSSITRLYAEKHAAKKVRMNSVLPGFVDSWDAPPEIVARIPAGRIATVAEVAKLVAFLVSEDAAYITGQNILIDGALVNAI